jgi:Putative beta-barrel porin-2, OmpL-like. bbp2
VNIASYGYFGEERVDGLVNVGPKGHRSLLDVVATWNVTETLTLIMNFDWGKQDNVVLLSQGSNLDAIWSGLAGYLNYAFSDHWKSSLRVEYLDDADGYRTGVAQTWRETTTTLAYLPSKHLELRGELRFDSSNVSSFRNSAVAGDDSKNQQSVGVQALFKF